MPEDAVKFLTSDAPAPPKDDAAAQFLNDGKGDDKDKDDPPRKPGMSDYFSAFERGFLRTAGEISGDPSPDFAASMGYQEPKDPTTGEKIAEGVGGLFTPMPLAGAGTAASSATDRALGTLGTRTGSGAILASERFLSRLPGGEWLVRAAHRLERTPEDIHEFVERLSGSRDVSTAGGEQLLKKAAARMSGTRGTAQAAETRALGQMLSHSIRGAGGTERIFANMMSGSRESAGAINTVLTHLGPRGRQYLAAHLLQRMGGQGEFSADTFIENWRRMSPGAKQAVFGDLPNGYAGNVDRLVRNVTALRAYARKAGDSSVLGGLFRRYGVLGEFGTAIWEMLHGHPKVAAAIGVSYGAVHVLSAALTNPSTTAWLTGVTTQMLTKVAAGASAAPSDQPDPAAPQNPYGVGTYQSPDIYASPQGAQ
jgi:hypothetical protein